MPQREYSQDRELGAGVVDVKGFYPETPEDVARRIHRVLAVCKPERLYVNPDCRFGWPRATGATKRSRRSPPPPRSSAGS